MHFREEPFYCNFLSIKPSVKVVHFLLSISLKCTSVSGQCSYCLYKLNRGGAKIEFERAVRGTSPSTPHSALVRPSSMYCCILLKLLKETKIWYSLTNLPKLAKEMLGGGLGGHWRNQEGPDRRNPYLGWDHLWICVEWMRNYPGERIGWLSTESMHSSCIINA